MASLTDTSSAKAGVNVTPTDGSSMQPTRAIWVGSDGDLAVRWSGNGQITVLKGAVAGLYPFSVTEIPATGTTATDIVALY